MGQNGKGWSDDGESYTLTAMDVPAVAFRQNASGDVTLHGGDGSTTGSLTASSSVSRQYCVAFPYNAAGKAAGFGASEDVSPTLRATKGGEPAVCMACDNGRAAVGEELCGTLKCGGRPPAVSDGYAVRRLMPVECERLQGFPDGWTDVGFRGRPAADTPRYAALGNSMAVPVMRWIGRRIEETDLFGGIREVVA